MGYQDFTDGSELSAAQVDEISKQGVLHYATTAAREADAALSVALREGMVSYVTATNMRYTYTGGTWAAEGPVHGALVGYTPIVTQPGTLSATVSAASTYSRVGRQVFGRFIVTITGTGVAATDIFVSL